MQRRIAALPKRDRQGFACHFANYSIKKSKEIVSHLIASKKQREVKVHFLMLGGLRYNRADLLELILEKGMIPLKELRESNFYQMVLEEGRDEGIAQAMLALVAKKFPSLEGNAEIESINHAAVLETRFSQALETKDADTFLKRLSKTHKR